MSPETIEKIKWLCENQQSDIRIPQEDWAQMLLDNENRIIGGNIRYFQGVKIGSGVVRIKLLPPEWDGKAFGTIELDPKTEWITKGTGLTLKKNKTCNSGC